MQKAPKRLRVKDSKDRQWESINLTLLKILRIKIIVIVAVLVKDFNFFF